jgi:hypothetical protein
MPTSAMKGQEGHLEGSEREWPVEVWFYRRFPGDGMMWSQDRLRSEPECRRYVPEEQVEGLVEALEHIKREGDRWSKERAAFVLASFKAGS